MLMNVQPVARRALRTVTSEPPAQDEVFAQSYAVAAATALRRAPGSGAGQQLVDAGAQLGGGHRPGDTAGAAPVGRDEPGLGQGGDRPAGGHPAAWAGP